MGSLLVDNIGSLVSWADDADSSTDRALVLSEGRVAWTGPAGAAPAADTRVDAGGACVIPGFVDSHTHLVFGGDRIEEFEARLAGQHYAAGGIRSTVRATRAASEEQLRASARARANEALRSGTTTLEIKSGYGLTVLDELRCLQIAREISEHTTLLGAHVVPDGSGREAYVSLVSGPMLQECAPFASAVDAFCEVGAFDVDECREVLAAGQAAGKALHVHANQLGPGPGVQLAAEMSALSADHCTHLTDSDVSAMADASVTAVLVPVAEFSTRSPYAPARRLLDAGVCVALATDCNPGTSYTTSMPFVIALACRELGLTPTEALHAATLGGARALGLSDVGHLGIGAKADLVVLDASSPSYLAYRPGVDLIRHVIRDGSVVL